MTKNMTRIGIGVATAALALGLGAAAFEVVGHAQAGPGIDRRGPGGPGPMGRGGRMGGPGRGGPGGPGVDIPLQQLGLSDAQREQGRTIVESHRDENKAIGDRLIAAHEALRAASTSGAFDEGLVRTRAAEVAAVESDAAVAHARVYSEIYQVLTPEQQAKLKEIQTNRQQRMAERRDDIRERRQR